MTETLETPLAGFAAELGSTLAGFAITGALLAGFAITGALLAGFAITGALLAGFATTGAGFAETLAVLLAGFATTGTGILGTTRPTSAPVLAAAKGSIGFSATPFVEGRGALLVAGTLAELAAALPVGFGFAAAPAAGLAIPTLADGAPRV